MVEQLCGKCLAARRRTKDEVTHLWPPKAAFGSGLRSLQMDSKKPDGKTVASLSSYGMIIESRYQFKQKGSCQSWLSHAKGKVQGHG
jgi:hypothetical protein